MQKKMLIALLACLLLASLSHAGLAELARVYVIVNHQDAPLTITDFGRYKYEDENHISSVVAYRNRTNRDIEALQITIIYFDPFNDKEDAVRGISTDALRAGQTDTGTWSVYGTPGFVKTGMAFVSAVRFMDGKVWKANLETVLKEAGKIPELNFLSQTEMLEIEKK